MSPEENEMYQRKFETDQSDMQKSQETTKALLSGVFTKLNGLEKELDVEGVDLVIKMRKKTKESIA